MKKICLFIFLLAAGSSCDPKQEQTTIPETGASRQAVLKDADRPKPQPETDEVNTPALGPNRLIVPGKSIGLIKLNEQAEVVFKLLGEPDKNDAAMGKLLATWLTKPPVSVPDTLPYQTVIFFSRNLSSSDPDNRIQQIRISSPAYSLENNIRVGSPFKTIQAHYPGLKKVAAFTPPGAKAPVTIYHDKSAGIAFEINRNGKCVGLCIQEPGESNFEVYTALADNFKRI